MEREEELTFLQGATLECTKAMMSRADNMGVPEHLRLQLFQMIAGHMLTLIHDVQAATETLKQETGNN